MVTLESGGGDYDVWSVRAAQRQIEDRGTLPSEALTGRVADAGRGLQHRADDISADHRQSRETGERELVLARWGLVPFCTKDLKDVKGLSTINARAETITKGPTWREPFKK